MDAKIAKVYYSYWKDTAAIKKLAEDANVPEDAAKKWLDRKMKPKFSDFYQPSEAQKLSEIIFVGGSALVLVLALGYAAFRFP